MTLSNFSKAVLVTLAVGLFAIPSVVVAQPGWNQELVSRPYWPGHYGPGTNYDRDVNGSDVSTPGHN